MESMVDSSAPGLQGVLTRFRHPCLQRKGKEAGPSKEGAAAGEGEPAAKKQKKGKVRARVHAYLVYV